jgi:splicing factor 3B subunit 2
MVAQISSAVNIDVENLQTKVNGDKAIKSKNQLRRLKAKQKKAVGVLSSCHWGGMILTLSAI